jgi:hypothetical protein
VDTQKPLILGAEFADVIVSLVHGMAPVSTLPLAISVRCLVRVDLYFMLLEVLTSCTVLEDAPAFDSLRKYQVRVENGDVIVEADEAALAAGRRKPMCVKHDKENKETVVIVGGGASGAAAAETLREVGYTGRIRVVSREDYFPIDR